MAYKYRLYQIFLFSSFDKIVEKIEDIQVKNFGVVRSLLLMKWKNFNPIKDNNIKKQ